MKSVKQGRGSSLGGVIGSFIAIVFGIVWTVMVKSMTAPFENMSMFGGFGNFFWIFGVVFIAVGVVSLILNLYNTFAKNRMSVLDITEDGEEPDPLGARFGTEGTPRSGTGGGFCPYCGAKAQEGFSFCRSCGRRLP